MSKVKVADFTISRNTICIELNPGTWVCNGYPGNAYWNGYPFRSEL